MREAKALIQNATSVLDEPIDRALHRPLAAYVVHFLRNTGVRPNHVTYASGIIGIAAGALLAFRGSDAAARGAAGLLLFVSCVLDCVDGQLARLRNEQSEMGRILDGIVDAFVGASVLLGVTVQASTLVGGFWTWVLGAASLPSVLCHAASFDCQKHRYGRAIGILPPEEPAEDLQRRRQVARREGHVSNWCLLGLYSWYLRLQRIGAAPVVDRDKLRFQRTNTRRFQIWTLMGPGTHFLLLYAGIWISVLWPWALVGCLVLYAIVLNAVYFWLLSTGWSSA